MPYRRLGRESWRLGIDVICLLVSVRVTNTHANYNCACPAEGYLVQIQDPYQSATEALAIASG
jgi:hypothetical protein